MCQLKFCLKKMLSYIMNNRLALYLDGKCYQGNQHKGFCMTRLSSDDLAVLRWRCNKSWKQNYVNIHVWQNYWNHIFHSWVNLSRRLNKYTYHHKGPPLTDSDLKRQELLNALWTFLKKKTCSHMYIIFCGICTVVP